MTQTREFCTICEVGHENGIRFLVMELIDSKSLEARLTKERLAPDTALECGAQIADALAAAHRGGIVHRDLEPGNVKLTKGGREAARLRTRLRSTRFGRQPSRDLRVGAGLHPAPHDLRT